MYSKKLDKNIELGNGGAAAWGLMSISELL